MRSRWCDMYQSLLKWRNTEHESSQTSTCWILPRTEAQMKKTTARALQTFRHRDFDIAFGNNEDLKARCKLVPNMKSITALQQPPSLAYSTNTIKADSWLNTNIWDCRLTKVKSANLVAFITRLISSKKRTAFLWKSSIFNYDDK